MEYLMRINYRSGIQEELWVSTFQIQVSNGIKEITWTAADPKHKPLLLGIDDIESVYQVKARKSKA